ncbi:hypothetical protein N8J89_08055 [Crossiella sp. CA-258035]|uniref:hypothetical protein n=1 Tax=Crossiella sp. CA-258035 TaxID=2981138 RepID=UPI0024BC4986|nr:hypothetical protein [Crossiella sp. CA-258035]WHT21008.1 hypothetical protein N8J89_08055 [Crossiella sp. CA-258035]
MPVLQLEESGEGVLMRYDITIPQGTTWTVSIPVLAPNGTPQNLTGWNAAGQVRAFHESPEVLHNISINLEGSNVVLTVLPTTSSAWAWRNGVYDVELTSPDSKVIRLVEGHVTVTPEVTR